MGFSLVYRRHILQGIRYALFALLLILLFSECYQRFPGIPKQLEYALDPELVTVLKPSQRGFIWLGNMSFPSPVVTINSDGHRGGETDWSQPTVISVGNSEAMGVGVADDEVWTSVLERELGSGETGGIQIVNAAHPGFGPSQQYILLRRVKDWREVKGIIVRVDIADRFFRVKTGRELQKSLSTAKARQHLRSISKGSSFLISKASAQAKSIRRAAVPWFMRKQAAVDNYSSAAIGEQMWKSEGTWWEGMAEIADSRNVRLFYVLLDALGTESAAVLERRLDEMSSRYRRVQVLRLGREAFGIQEASSDETRRLFNASLTLGRDPHANAEQHRLIAKAISGQIALIKR